MACLYFPMFYNITDWNICFVGAGKVAERRIKGLLSYPCHIFIISKEISEYIRKQQEIGNIIWFKEEIGGDGGQTIENVFQKIKKIYADYFLERKEFSVVFSCTNQRNVNQEIYYYCKRKNIPVNTADCKEQSDFYFPGLLEWENIVIGVTGNGEDHKKVKAVMDKLRTMFPMDKK